MFVHLYLCMSCCVMATSFSLLILKLIHILQCVLDTGLWSSVWPVSPWDRTNAPLFIWAWPAENRGSSDVISTQLWCFPNTSLCSTSQQRVRGSVRDSVLQREVMGHGPGAALCFSGKASVCCLGENHVKRWHF